MAGIKTGGTNGSSKLTYQSDHSTGAGQGRIFLTKGKMTRSVFTKFLRDESGATAIEYALIAAGISVVIITAVNTLGGQVKTTFTNVKSSLANAGK